MKTLSRSSLSECGGYYNFANLKIFTKPSFLGVVKARLKNFKVSLRIKSQPNSVK
jgi:hypothetical protein